MMTTGPGHILFVTTCSVVVGGTPPWFRRQDGGLKGPRGVVRDLCPPYLTPTRRCPGDPNDVVVGVVHGEWTEVESRGPIVPTRTPLRVVLGPIVAGRFYLLPGVGLSTLLRNRNDSDGVFDRDSIPKPNRPSPKVLPGPSLTPSFPSRSSFPGFSFGSSSFSHCGSGHPSARTPVEALWTPDTESQTRNLTGEVSRSVDPT